MKNLFQTEPALVLGFVQAAIALGVSFGLSLSAEQIGALLAFSAAGLSLGVRRMVTPVASLEPSQIVPPEV